MVNICVYTGLVRGTCGTYIVYFIVMRRESEFFLDDIRCAAIQNSQRKRSANVIYQLLFGILEKTHYKIIITDQMCNSVDKFLSHEEVNWLKKINYKMVVNDNKYVSMEYLEFVIYY